MIRYFTSNKKNKKIQNLSNLISKPKHLRFAKPFLNLLTKIKTYSIKNILFNFLFSFVFLQNSKIHFEF